MRNRLLGLLLIGYSVFATIFQEVKGQNLKEFQGLPFITNHEALTYHAGIQNFDIIQDDLGRIFVANNLGLLEFDGKSWARYGLNNTKVRSAFLGSDKKIYVGSQADFGFLSHDGQGNLAYTSLADSLPKGLRDFDETWRVFGMDKFIYFCTFTRIYVYDGKVLRALDPGRRMDISFQVDNQLYTQIPGEGLFQVNSDRFEPIRNGDFFKDKRVSNILSYDRDRWLITTFSHGIFLYDGEVRPFQIESGEWKNEFLINYSTRLRNGSIALATQNAGLFVLDKEGNLLDHLDKDSGLQDLTINFIFEDSQSGLWLAMNNGLARVELSSPFSVIDDRMGLTGAGYAALKLDDVIYLGTNNGLFLWKNGKISFVKGTEGQVYSIQEVRGKVVLNHHNGTFLIENDGAVQISSVQGAWILKQHPKQSDYYIQGTYTGLSLLKWQNGSLSFVKKIKGFGESSRVMEFEDTTLWVAHGYKGVFKLKLSDDLSEVVETKLYNSAQGFPNNDLINVFKVNSRLLFTANGGFYGYASEEDRFSPLSEFNDLFGYGTVVADLEPDELGNIYFIEQSRLGVIKPQQNHQLSLNYSSFNKVKRLWNDDLANVIVLDNQNILIGGKQGFIHYHPSLDLPRADGPKVFFRQIRNQGKESQVIFSGHGLSNQPNATLEETTFSYSQNSFFFEFGSAHFESGEEIHYQYLLENYEEEWSPWTSEIKKEYTNLREGDYVFKVRSKTVFDEVSPPVEFRFTVKPPIYRSVFAYAVYAFSLFAFLFVGFKWLDRRHKKQTLKLEQEKDLELRQKDDVIETITLQSEQEIMRLKNDQLQSQIEFKNQELTSSAMNLIQKNKLLNTIKGSLKNLMEENKSNELNAQLSRLVRSIDKDLEGVEDWSAFAESFDQVHGRFITRLKEKFPELTPQEIKFSAYIRMNLNTKEIANLLGISVRGVEIGRYRVRKKLGLARQDSLSDFLLRF
ncbi:triple tyrosine motif-containing protein [Algoriphagus lacus]|nr:triple tyrosine motif-containing protein [Algoriphagus lacus]